MPTGYTQKIESQEGCTFEQFVWICSRAFLFHARDTPAGQRVPLAEVSRHNKEALEKAEAEHARVLNLRPDEVHELGRKLLEQRFKSKNGVQQKLCQEKARYQEMAQAVSAWGPTSRFLELKEFMLNQITTCQRYHGTGDAVAEPKYTVSECLEAFAEHVDWLKTDIENCKEEMRKEQERVADTNSYILELEAVVPQPFKNSP